MTYDPLNPDNADCEMLLEKIAKATDNTIANVQRRVGTDIKKLKAEAKRLENRNPKSTSLVVVDGDQVNIDRRAAEKISDDLGLNLETLRYCFGQLINLLRQSDGKLDADTASAVIQLFLDLRPTDSIEAMLAVSAISTHILSGRLLRHLSVNISTHMASQTVRPLVNLIKTEAAIFEQIDHRRRGPSVQKVVVERVEVSGGQAVVGAVEGGHVLANDGRTS
ncbi:MAG: hypothetical protein GY847_10305 [Proteobacteria bacterium]|nr:hypothetical protein [Pseudomonadota bacterium]